MPIKFTSDKPIFLQLAEIMKTMIVSGKLKVDEKLPSVRELAFSYSINPNTVQKAYNVLENEGYIKVLPKKGVYVIYDKQESNYAEIKNELLDLKDKISYDDLIKIVNEIYGREINDRN